MNSFYSLNKIMLMGRLGQDPEIYHAQSGTVITNFSLATSESYKKGDDWEERTEWHKIVVFGNTAEACANYLKKGSLVYIEGRMQTRNYQDKNGNEKYITEIILNEIKFLDKKDQQ